MPPRTPDSAFASVHNRLGKEPDYLIALELGVSRSLVMAYRKRHGIPAYDGYQFTGHGTQKKDVPPTPKPITVPPVEAQANKPASSFKGRTSALDPYADLLGKVPDTEIARMAGVTPENVRTYRGRRGIPALWKERDGLDHGPVPVASPEASPAPRSEPEALEATVPEAATTAAEAAGSAATEDAVDNDTAGTGPQGADISSGATLSESSATQEVLIFTFLVTVKNGGEEGRYAVKGTNVVTAAQNATAAVAQRWPEAEVTKIEKFYPFLE